MTDLEVDVQVACDDGGIPSAETISDWVAATVSAIAGHDVAEVSVRVVDEDEIRTLNRLYRDKDQPTNVLAFPAGDIAGLPVEAPRSLGDVVVCASVVATEAKAQARPLEDHWAHMLVHGTLHLLGFDHENDRDAAEMEALEAKILGAGSVTDPYSG